MPLLPVPTKQKETQRPARRAEKGESERSPRKFSKWARLSACLRDFAQKEKVRNVFICPGAEADTGPRTSGWEGGGNVKIEALPLFVSKTVCGQVRACSTRRTTHTHTHTRGRRLIYGCGYFTTSATHIPFGSANEKHWKVAFPLYI